MPATRLALAALRISRKPLLQAAPAILTAAAELVGRLSDRRRASSDPGSPITNASALFQRVETLEASSVSQADITKEIAGQLKELTQALRVVAVRTSLAIGLSLAATVMALVAVIRSFR
jgi:hypothetical protein